MQTDASGSQKYKEFLKHAVKHENTFWSLANAAFSQLRGKMLDLPIPTPIDDGANVIVRESVKKTQDAENPFFLFANFMDAHGPTHQVLGYDRSIGSAPLDWNPTKFDSIERNLRDSDDEERDLETYRDLYATAIDYLDRKIVSLIEQLQEVNSHETTVIITADHGENLEYPEDEGLFNHVSSLSESLLHVPLYIVNPPSGYDSTESDYFSHLRLGELISGLAYGETPDVFDDHIASELVGGNPAIQNVAREYGELEYWDRMQRCVYGEETKFLWDSLDNRFTYKLDEKKPCWQEQVASDIDIPSWAGEHFDEDIYVSKEKAQKRNQQKQVDQATEERLDALGYK